jgi:adenylate cyclase
MKYQEVEKKFQVARLPSHLSKYPHENIHQGYLARTSSNIEIRVRKKGKHHFLTVKEGSGLKRTELEVKLTDKQFRVLWPMTKGLRIEKVRYRIPYQGVVIEVDIYQGKLRGLKKAEVEFSSGKQRQTFRSPGWFGKEITSKSQYSNWDLAKYGLPKEARGKKS